MIEPIAGNMNFVRASVPFMQRLRELCTQHGALLVFDEVMTGFRVALGGAQSALRARRSPASRPTSACFGKVIGGGMPLAAFGGPRAVMEQLAPLGPGLPGRHAVGQPGGHRLRPGDAARDRASPASSTRWRRARASLVDGLVAAAAGAPACRCRADSEGGMFGFFFADALPQNYAAVMATDKERFNRFFHAMLERGVYLAPALYEAGFVSAAHSESDIAATLAAARESLAPDSLAPSPDPSRSGTSRGPSAGSVIGMLSGAFFGGIGAAEPAVVERRAPRGSTPARFISSSTICLNSGSSFDEHDRQRLDRQELAHDLEPARIGPTARAGRTAARRPSRSRRPRPSPPSRPRAHGPAPRRR